MPKIFKKKRNFQSIIYLITTKKVIECFSKLGDLIITNGDTGRAAGLYYVEDYIAKVNYFIKNNQKTLQSNAEIVSLKVVGNSLYQIRPQNKLTIEKIRTS